MIFKCLISLACLSIVYSQRNGICDCFIDSYQGEYICNCQDVLITESSKFFEVEVQHVQGMTDENVAHLIFGSTVIEVNSPAIFEKFSAIETISLSYVYLKKLVPIFNCSKLKNLLLYQNFLAKVEAGIFDECSGITHLNFYGNFIQQVDEVAFDGLGNLKRLDLSNNKIAAINQRIFRKLKNLTYLNLQDNRIKVLPEGIFSDLSKLETIFIDRNGIVEIHPTSFHGLKSLIYLFATNNSIADFHQQTFKDCRNLAQLSLKSNNLTTIHDFLGNNLPKLEFLFLSDNKIDSIHPLFFRNLTSLRSLHLEKNICVDKNFIIEYHNVHEQVLPYLKTCFENYEDVPENAVMCKFFIHDEFGYTCELSGISYDNSNTSFSISGNHLNEMMDSDVKTLIFSNSTISKIPPEIFQKLSNVESLLAKNAKFEKIDGNVLENCGNLKHLDLSENQITTLNDDAFNQCKNLTSINLAGNQISSMSAKVFQENLFLESIYLDRNKISVIEPCDNVIRFHLKNLKHLSMKWNICIHSSFHHQSLHLFFDKIVLKDVKVCYSFWFL